MTDKDGRISPDLEEIKKKIINQYMPNSHPAYILDSHGKLVPAEHKTLGDCGGDTSQSLEEDTDPCNESKKPSYIEESGSSSYIDMEKFRALAKGMRNDKTFGDSPVKGVDFSIMILCPGKPVCEIYLDWFNISEFVIDRLPGGDYSIFTIVLQKQFNTMDKLKKVKIDVEALNTRIVPNSKYASIIMPFGKIHKYPITPGESVHIRITPFDSENGYEVLDNVFNDENKEIVPTKEFVHLSNVNSETSTQEPVEIIRKNRKAETGSISHEDPYNVSFQTTPLARIWHEINTIRKHLGLPPVEVNMYDIEFNFNQFIESYMEDEISRGFKRKILRRNWEK